MGEASHLSRLGSVIRNPAQYGLSAIASASIFGGTTVNLDEAFHHSTHEDVAAIISPAPVANPHESLDQTQTPKTIGPEEVVKRAASSTQFKARSGCTSIRRRANDIYMGRACRSGEAQYQMTDGGHAEKGWVYSTIAVSGIYKCGFVRAGVLQQADLNPEAVKRCEQYYVPLSVETDTFFEDDNCDDVRPGLQGCRSGTLSSEVNNSSEDYIPTYGNFATDDPSPLNVFGAGEGGFSMPIDAHIKDSASYRTQIKHAGGFRKAIVVKSLNETDALDWVIIDDKYIDHDQRQGGLPTRQIG